MIEVLLTAFKCLQSSTKFDSSSSFEAVFNNNNKNSNSDDDDDDDDDDDCNIP